MLKNIFLISLILFFIPKSYQIAKVNLTKTISYPNRLIIPKIKLNEPFYDLNDERNNLNYGLQKIVPTHDGPILLASHSGNGIHSYFKNLEQLNLNDEFFIQSAYKIQKYTIKEKKYKDKDGQLTINNLNQKALILITCSKIWSDKQVYFVGIS